jgi:diguanylate cyclase
MIPFTQGDTRMFNMLRELFVNVLIIIASISLGNMITRDRDIMVKKGADLLLGSLCGIFGSLLIIYGVKVSDSVLVDFRCIPILLMGIYISFSSSMITAVIIGLFRITYYGVNSVTLAAFGIAIACGICCGLIGKLKVSIVKKWIFAYFCIVVITGSGFVFLLHDPEVRKNVLLSYMIGLTVITAISYLLMHYIMKSNVTYYHMESAVSMDFLTGLHNLRSFDYGLNSAIRYAKNTGGSVSLLYLDIDRFKLVNDVYGHVSGDYVLRDFGRLLAQESRETDLVSRNGGEEFSVVLAKCDIDTAVRIAERLREKVEQTVFFSEDHQSIRITVSIGVANYPLNADKAEELVLVADKALYAAKQSGRNRVLAAEPLHAGMDCVS